MSFLTVSCEVLIFPFEQPNLVTQQHNDAAIAILLLH